MEIGSASWPINSIAYSDGLENGKLTKIRLFKANMKLFPSEFMELKYLTILTVWFEFANLSTLR